MEGDFRVEMVKSGALGEKLCACVNVERRQHPLTDLANATHLSTYPSPMQSPQRLLKLVCMCANTNLPDGEGGYELHDAISRRFNSELTVRFVSI